MEGFNGHGLFVLYHPTYARYVERARLSRQKVEGRVPGAGRRTSVFNGDRVSVRADEKVLEMHGGDDDCTTTRMYLTPLNRTSKMVTMINFMLYVFHHIQTTWTCLFRMRVFPVPASLPVYSRCPLKE